MPEIYSLPGFHEPFSAATHLCGAAAFVVLGYLMLRRGRGDPARLFFLSIYANSCVFLFSMSGGYHMAIPGGNARLIMERLDHAAIFLLIAGTFTPIHGILFHGWLRWGALLVMWIAAIASLTLKTIFFHSTAQWLGLVGYLVLGWFGLVSGGLLAHRYGYAFVRPLLWGGLCYSAGAIANFINWPAPVPGLIHAHEVFHLSVLAGAFLHWRFIWQFAAGPDGRLASRPGHDERYDPASPRVSVLIN